MSVPGESGAGRWLIEDNLDPLDPLVINASVQVGGDFERWPAKRRLSIQF